MLMTVSTITFAQQADPINLYPHRVPNSKPAPADYKENIDGGNVSLVIQPQLLAFFPPEGKANGTSVVICPGGGYARLSIVKEGQKIAEKFNEIGITAFVLKYRLPSDQIMVDKTIGPLQDAQRAIQIVRENAVKWKLDPARVGIMGFSAGGHLASTAGTQYVKAVIANPDHVNLRPDFMILLYPVITFGPYAHQNSKDNLLGKEPSAALIENFSGEKQVKTDTPPTFIVHAQDDAVVPIQNALLFYEALTANHVKAEMHIYPAGGHGFGLNNLKSKAYWFDWLKGWLGDNGW